MYMYLIYIMAVSDWNVIANSSLYERSQIHIISISFFKEWKDIFLVCKNNGKEKTQTNFLGDVHDLLVPVVHGGLG